MADDLKALLLAGQAADDVKVDTHAGVVTVRGLTRSEVLHLNKGRELGTVDVAEYERKMVALALVDPVMSEDEVKTWQEHDRASGALADVTDAIAELSGLSQGADKSGVPGAGA